MSLKGKTAIITGSNSGIGLGVARELAKAGADVVLNSFTDRDEDHKLAADLGREFGVTARYIKADLSSGEEARALITQAGKCDILVNNAGIQHVEPIETFPAATWDRIIAINLSSAFHTMRLAMPMMASRGFGRVVNIASVHGLVASKDKAPYVASKFGIVGLSKVAALEYAAVGSRDSGGVTVNCICPGWVETPLIEPQIEARRDGGSREDGVRALLGEKQPSLRMSLPEDIAATAVWLCRREAHNITGTTVPIDGGWTAQ